MKFKVSTFVWLVFAVGIMLCLHFAGVNVFLFTIGENPRGFPLQCYSKNGWWWLTFFIDAFFWLFLFRLIYRWSEKSNLKNGEAPKND